MEVPTAYSERQVGEQNCRRTHVREEWKGALSSGQRQQRRVQLDFHRSRLFSHRRRKEKWSHAFLSIQENGDHFRAMWAYEGLKLAEGGIGFYGHSLQCIEEPLVLPEEEPICSKRCNGCYSACKPIIARSNHRAMGQIRVDEFAWDGKDQAGLNRWIERAEEIGKCQARCGVR